jgi:hypothetical protein
LNLRTKPHHRLVHEKLISLAVRYRFFFERNGRIADVVVIGGTNGAGVTGAAARILGRVIVVAEKNILILILQYYPHPGLNIQSGCSECLRMYGW